MNARIATTFLFSAALAACSGSGGATIPQSSSPSFLQSAAASGGYFLAYRPGSPSVLARYALPAKGDVTPSSVVSGGKTEFSSGSVNSGGLVLAKDGTAIVLDANEPAPRFLAFAADASGNAKPLWSANLPTAVPSFYSYASLAIDSKGTLWTVAVQNSKVVGFGGLPSSTTPAASISPKMNTPLGMMSCRPSAVAVDKADVIYVLCNALANHGSQATGISQYVVDAKGHAKLKSTFYDLNLPEQPCNMIAVSRDGTMYVASSGLPRVVFAYAYDRGNVTKRAIYGNKTGLKHIESLAVDRYNRLWVATPKGMLLFGPQADGNVSPFAHVRDTQHLQYDGATEQFGSFIAFGN